VNGPKLVRALHCVGGMRIVRVVGALAVIGLASRSASAGKRHDSPEVRDHRSSSDDSGHVRDHRSSDSGHSEPVVRDHRGDDPPVVRDHRSSSSGGGDSMYVSDEPIDVSDGGSPRPFGAYSGPSWTLEIGGVARRFQGPAFAQSGSVETTDGDMASYDLASGTPSAGDTAAGAFAMRFTVPASEHLYAGAEVEIGGLTRSPVQLMTDSSDIRISQRSMLGSLMVVGARAQHGIAELDGELAGGLRMVSMTMQSFDAIDGDPSASEHRVSGLVEARVRAALWVAPHVFIAAQAGSSLLDRSDVNVGLSIGLASRAYGAQR
jgi:hypothetical protein